PINDSFSQKISIKISFIRKKSIILQQFNLHRVVDKREDDHSPWRTKYFSSITFFKFQSEKFLKYERSTRV
ncbi:MAG: hypothetical protein IJ430_11165, partial [Parabacteroides sp.]|nr:hypothetical protein [Parabacteroides sp.]